MSASKPRSILNWAGDKHYEQLPRHNEQLSITDAFGDSGDVFNHRVWRDFFLGASTSPEFCKQVTNVATQVMFRARQLKIAHRGKIISFNLQTDSVNDEVLKSVGLSKPLFALDILMATETTKVDANTLTIERFKCVVRDIVVPRMMLAKRLPATSSAIGYDKMALDLMILREYHNNIERIMTEKKNDKFKFEDLGKAGTEFNNYLQDKPFYIDAIKVPLEAHEAFDDLFAEAKNYGVTAWMNASSAFSGAVSQKEVYMECEMAFPGTIFWAGVHSLMTDVSNKKKASEVPADQQAKFENSNFYGDFKKKQSARNIEISKTKTYVDMLTKSVRVMALYLRAGTHITAAESAVMDNLMERIKQKLVLQPPELKQEGIDGASSSNVERLMKNIEIRAETLIEKTSERNAAIAASTLEAPDDTTRTRGKLAAGKSEAV